MKKKNVIGPRIRRLRNRRGWSQNDMAIKLQLAGFDLCREGVAKIEGCTRNVLDFELICILSVLEIELPELLKS